MPYILSHITFALPLGESLGCFSDAESRQLFLLGCLGPDVYFFDRLPPTPFRPNQKKHGNRLHHLPCDALATALLTRSDGALRPYVYGFLTHIALDSTLHPYVCSRYHGLDHSRFEGDIDAALYARIRDDAVYRRLFFRPAKLDALDALLTDVSLALVGVGCPGAYRRSVRKLLRLYPLLFDPDGKRFRRISRIERLFRKEGAVSGFLLAAPRSYFDDCMNERRAVWYAKPFPDVPRTETVDELFESARALAGSLIRAAQRNDADTVTSLLGRRTMEEGPLP